MIIPLATSIKPSVVAFGIKLPLVVSISYPILLNWASLKPSLVQKRSLKLLLFILSTPPKNQSVDKSTLSSIPVNDLISSGVIPYFISYDSQFSIFTPPFLVCGNLYK